MQAKNYTNVIASGPKSYWDFEKKAPGPQTSQDNSKYISKKGKGFVSAICILQNSGLEPVIWSFTFPSFR